MRRRNRQAPRYFSHPPQSGPVLRMVARSLIVGSLLLAAGCGGDSTAPTPTAATIDLSQDAVTLELGGTVTLEATPRTNAGATVDVPVTWSTSDPNVVTVDASGRVTGAAAGTATVTASAGTARATAQVEVLGFRSRDVVLAVDSSQWTLMSDSAEQAGGTYRFQRLSGSGSPPFAVGSVIVGAQDGGFLRKVTSVDVSGDVVSMQTEQALLQDLIAEGELGFKGSLLGGAPLTPTPARMVRLRSGELVRPTVRLGPLYVRSTSDQIRAAASKALATSSLIDVNDFDVCAFFKEAELGECPSYVDEFMLKTLSIDFDPDFDFGTTWNEAGDLTEFHGIASGRLQSRTEASVGLKFSGSFTREATLLEIGRIVYIQLGVLPVVVHVEAEMKATFEVTATVKGKLQGGVETDHTADVGATWDTKNGWQAKLDGDGTFTPIQPSVDDSTAFTSISLQAKISLTPELNMKFYGVAGPLIGLGPYALAELEATTTSCGFDSSAGLDAKVGIALADFVSDKLDNPDFTKTRTLATLQGATWACPVGNLAVTAATTGTNPDPDGYQLTVDGNDYGALSSNGSATFNNVRLGTRSVGLRGVANNCRVDGQNPTSVSVSPTGTTVAFNVTCADTTGTGDLHVTVNTTGPVPDPDGYDVTVNASQLETVGTNGSVDFHGIAAGQVDVFLGDLASNCTVQGSNPQSVLLGNGQSAQVSFSVTCTGGTLQISTSTTGPYLEGHQMQAVVDDGQSVALGSNDTKSVTVVDGDRSVQLQDLPGQCTVTSDNPATVNVPDAGTASVSFKVDCPPGDLVVTATTNGDSTVTSYTVTLDGADPRDIDAHGGSITYAKVATGNHSIELTGVPGTCSVLDENPRTVPAPGSTQFTVDCGTGSGGDLVISDEAGIWTMRADGTNPLLILPTQTADSGLKPFNAVWKDQSTILFGGSQSGEQGIWTMAEDGSNVSRIPISAPQDWSAKAPSVSPGGTRVASYGGVGQLLWVTSLSGGGTRPVLAVHDSVDANWSDWVPGGTEILFAGAKNGDEGSFRLYTVSATRDTTSGGPVPFDVPGSMRFDPRYSPDGTYIAYRNIDADLQNGEIRIAPASGGDASTVVFSSSDWHSVWCGCNMAWSPDGKSLAFGATVNGVSGIYRVDVDGSNLVLLRGLSSLEMWVDWR